MNTDAKKSSTMRTEATMSSHLTPVRMATSLNQQQVLTRVWRNGALPTAAGIVGLQTGAASRENN